MSNKPIIFISHIHEEADLAKIIRDHLEQTFPEELSIFVSSQPESIDITDKWLLENIRNALENMEFMISLISPQSFPRHWIHFEFGVAWQKEDCSLLPLCHSGAEPQSLPAPLNAIQGLNINSTEALSKITSKISEKFSIPITQSNKEEESRALISTFQQNYTFYSIVARNIYMLLRLKETKQHLNDILSNNSTEIEILASFAHTYLPMMDFLMQKNILRFDMTMNKMLEVHTNIFKVSKMENFDSTIQELQKQKLL